MATAPRCPRLPTPNNGSAQSPSQWAAEHGPGVFALQGAGQRSRLNPPVFAATPWNVFTLPNGNCARSCCRLPPLDSTWCFSARVSVS